MEKILVIGAMKVETDELIGCLVAPEAFKVGAFDVTKGVVNKTQVYVCCCGIGKVNSAAAVSAILALNSDINLVTNLGVAGGVGKGIVQGDIVVATKTVQHDCNSTADGLVHGQVNGFSDEFFACDSVATQNIKNAATSLGYNVFGGIVASGDEFVNSNKKVKWLAKQFNAIACDMESAAINHVCVLYKVPFVAMRAISDGGDDEALISFYRFLADAANRSTATLIKWLNC